MGLLRQAEAGGVTGSGSEVAEGEADDPAHLVELAAGVAEVAAVAPGGALVILSHDLEAMRDPKHQHRPFDPDAYLHIDDFAAVLDATAGWIIEVNDKRPRPAGSASATDHADDRVLRARRTT